MCITDYGLVISGPGSRDGRIAVWGSHLATDNRTDTDKCPCSKPLEETEVISVCEEDGFDVIGKKDAVQFDLARNQTHYIPSSAGPGKLSFRDTI